MKSVCEEVIPLNQKLKIQTAIKVVSSSVFLTLCPEWGYPTVCKHRSSTHPLIKPSVCEKQPVRKQLVFKQVLKVEELILLVSEGGATKGLHQGPV